MWVELGGRDDFGELLHVGWFDVNNIEALVLDVQVPQVDSQVVAGNESLSVRVYGYAVDMVSMSISIGPPRNCSNNCIVMCETGQSERGWTGELRRWLLWMP